MKDLKRDVSYFMRVPLPYFSYILPSLYVSRNMLDNFCNKIQLFFSFFIYIFVFCFSSEKKNVRHFYCSLPSAASFAVKEIIPSRRKMKDIKKKKKAISCFIRVRGSITIHSWVTILKKHAVHS